MKRNTKAKITKTSGSKLVWLMGAAGVVFALLYWELSGLLYVLSTLALCAFFIVVAFSDLETGLNEIDGNEG